MKMSATLKIIAALVAASPVIALAHHSNEHADHAAIGSFIKASDAGEWLAKARTDRADAKTKAQSPGTKVKN